MKLFDITQELFTANVYPGDLPPMRKQVLDMTKGDSHNLSHLNMCAHNGTHIDSPLHFVDGGKDIAGMDLDLTIGPCVVRTATGSIGRAEALVLIEGGVERLLIRGDITITLEGAEVFADSLKLLGVESQSVSPKETTLLIHGLLLRHEVALLEGAMLKDVADGNYFLYAAPIKLGQTEGAPCRAILVQE